MKAGLDFGTTNTTLAFLQGGQLSAFKQHKEFDSIYSALYYGKDGDTVVGHEALIACHQEGDRLGHLYQGFKMLLPLDDQSRCAQPGPWTWGDKAPRDVVRDFLGKLLVEGENSFRNYAGDLDSLVVSVPQLWHKDPFSPGAVALKQILRHELGLPLEMLVSEPAAAAAYLVWIERRDDPEFTGDILVCDAGGGTFDVSLCRAGERQIDVLWFDGTNSQGLRNCGVGFDHAAVELAWRNKFGCTPDPADPLFHTTLHEFERQKIFSAKSLHKGYLIYSKDTERYKAKSKLSVLDFAGLTISSATVDEAFAPIAKGIQRVMQAAKEQIARDCVSLKRVVLVGGFSNFFLLRSTVLQALGISEDHALVRNMHRMHIHRAIANGACLVAEDAVRVCERYPHALGLTVTLYSKEGTAIAEMGKRDAVIIKAGTPTGEWSEPAYFPPSFEGSQDYPFLAPGRSLKIEVFAHLSGEPQASLRCPPLEVRLPEEIGQKCRVGLQVNSSNLARLWLEFPDGRTLGPIDLGSVLTQSLSIVAD